MEVEHRRPRKALQPHAANRGHTRLGPGPCSMAVNDVSTEKAKYTKYKTQKDTCHLWLSWYRYRERGPVQQYMAEHNRPSRVPVNSSLVVLVFVPVQVRTHSMRSGGSTRASTRLCQRHIGLIRSRTRVMCKTVENGIPS